MNPDETTEIHCPHCGHVCMVADVEWDWTRKDMSDFKGCCPKCHKDYWEGK